ncbi:MAG: DUF4443 domain-containing protein [Candidatus Bathyarchaeia archaeon]
MRIINVFEELARGKAPGPLPSFTELHLAKTIEIIGVEGPIGRKKLSRKLRLGEGTVRTIVTRLEGAHLISISRAGCELTKKGKAIYDVLKSKLVRMSPIKSSPLTIGAYNVGVVVRDAAHKVRHGVEQRDAAIKAGAVGATMLLYKDNRLVMPAISEDVMKEYPNIAKQIMELFQPKENDVIILGGADTRDGAEDGARAAAWTLIETRS